MPDSGEKNKLFGVYASACCGAEIVIAVGVEFPVCPNHQLSATWDPVEVTPKEVIVIHKKSNLKPAHSLGRLRPVLLKTQHS